MRKVGVDADCGHMGQVGIGFVEFIDLFGHRQNALFCVCGMETGELHTAE